VLPCAPTRAGDPALMPPVSMRSPMTSATEVRSGKMLALDGSVPSASTVNEAPRGGRPFDGHDVWSCARTGPAISSVTTAAPQPG